MLRAIYLFIMLMMHTGNSSVITNAISSVALSGGTGTDLTQNSKVTVTLDMTVLQSEGVKHGDQLQIEYDPNSETNGLKSKAVTLNGTAITSETIGSFDTYSMLICRICQKSTPRATAERILS